MATIRQLEAFIATAEFKNMSEAAKHLYISQPTVSQIISELEKEYDTKLFDRNAKELGIQVNRGLQFTVMRPSKLQCIMK